MLRQQLASALLAVALIAVLGCGSTDYGAATPATSIEVAAPAIAEATPTTSPTAVIEPSATPQPPLEPTIAATATQAIAAAPAVAAPTRAPTPPTQQPSATSPPAPERPPPMTIQAFLNLADRSFEPHQIHGNAGDTVAVTLSGSSEQHTFTIDSLEVDVVIPVGQTKEVSFVVPSEGETPFYCRFHGSPASGMHGLLIFH